MMQPKRTKYRKPHRTRYDGKAKGNKYVAFGEYGLMATTGGNGRCLDYTTTNRSCPCCFI